MKPTVCDERLVGGGNGSECFFFCYFVCGIYFLLGLTIRSWLSPELIR